MTPTVIIYDKEKFISNATSFFNILFEPSLNSGFGDIEIRTFPKNQAPEQFFCKSESEASQIAYQLCNSGIDVYFGVNPRTGNAGKKENVYYLAAFHAEVDYGLDGHKKKPVHESYDAALSAITGFNMKPTILNHSGGGFHCYWVLSNPVKVAEKGITLLENVNRALLIHLGGDGGTHNLDRVLRVPGTFNFKFPENPREVINVWMDGPKCSYDDFHWLAEEAPVQKEKMQGAAQNKVHPTKAYFVR